MGRKRMTPQELLDAYLDSAWSLADKRKDFTHMDFSGHDFAPIRKAWNAAYRKTLPVDLSYSSFEDCNLSRMHLSGSRDICTTYDHARMKKVYKVGSVHQGASFRKVNLYAAHLEKSDNTPYQDEKDGKEHITDFSDIRGYGLFWSRAQLRGMRMHNVHPDVVRTMRFSFDALSEELKRKILAVDLSKVKNKEIEYGRRHNLYPARSTAAPFVRWGELVWSTFRDFEKISYDQKLVDQIVDEVMKEFGVDYSH